MTFFPPEWRDLADTVLKRLQAGETVRNTESVVRTKSEQLVPILATAFILADEADRPVAIFTIIKDMKRTAERLQHQHRNRELKQFVATVSHDLAASGERTVPFMAAVHCFYSLLFMCHLTTAIRNSPISDAQATQTNERSRHP